MAETLLTKKIKIALYYYTKANLQGVYGGFEIVMGNNTSGYGNEYVDFVTMNSDNEFRCYEIKVSKADLYSKSQLSFYGDFNYLVVPEELTDEAIKFVRERYGDKTGILVYCEPDYEKKSIQPYFLLARRPKRQKVRIEQRIANMHNMIRSGSRYTKKWVSDQKRLFSGVFSGLPKRYFNEEEWKDMFGSHDDDILESVEK